jgi:hypothetical protein
MFAVVINKEDEVFSVINFGHILTRYDTQHTDIQHNYTQKDLFVILSITATQHNNVLYYAESRYAECRVLIIVMLSYSNTYI